MTQKSPLNILFDTLQCNIINVIFIVDGNHFHSYSTVAAAAKICDSCCVRGKRFILTTSRYNLDP